MEYRSQKALRRTEDGQVYRGYRRRQSTEQYIEKAKKVHGERFDYSKTKYLASDEIVCVICPEHGEFYPLASAHLAGSGCHCCSGCFNFKKPAIVYLVKFTKPSIAYWKIGITNRNVSKRFHGNTRFITEQYIWSLPTGRDAAQLEQLTLKVFDQYRINPDVLKQHNADDGGKTECFAENVPHQEIIKFLDKQVAPFYDKQIVDPSDTHHHKMKIPQLFEKIHSSDLPPQHKFAAQTSLSNLQWMKETKIISAQSFEESVLLLFKHFGMPIE